MWRLLKWTGGLVLFGVALLAGLFVYGVGPANFGRLVLGVRRNLDPDLLQDQRLPGRSADRSCESRARADRTRARLGQRRHGECSGV